MSLAFAPAVLMLIGLVAYVVLGGADFGAGLWQLAAGRGARAVAVRQHAYRAMGPVWEANHVWLIFVLVVFWTAYPVAFGSIASTLSIPMFVGAIGIVLRGAAYALRASAVTAHEQRRVELVFSVSSILTPFALGAVVGGIASARVPVGNARGDLVRSWLNPTSVTVGSIAVACAAYLAAVYLAADAVRLRSPRLVSAFRARALISGAVAGALSIGGLFVLRTDAPRIWHGLTHGGGLVALVVTAVAGVTTLLLAARGAFGNARVTASLAVAAIVTGWGFAQQPLLLRTLTIRDAAAPHRTLVALLTAVGTGAVLLTPSLALLFWLVLTGRFDPRSASPMRADEPLQVRKEYVARETVGLVALACFAVGTLLVNYPDRAWARIAGVAALFAFVVSGFLFVALARDEEWHETKT